VHQFEKVELFSIVAPDAGPTPSTSASSRHAARDPRGLELHAQVVDIPVGDLGSSAARKFDVEAWMPGQGAFREVTSCSNTTDYQARRLRIRMRVEGGDNVLGPHAQRDGAGRAAHHHRARRAAPAA
jgi:seryl-tRNA synthetase